jgi:general L-amino acid transport system permease protein
MAVDTLPPPRTYVGPLVWTRQNLFGSIPSAIVTLLMLVALAWLAYTVAGWAFTQAQWQVIFNNLRLFLIGQYPADQGWRLWLDLALISLLSGASAAVFGGTTRALAVSVSAIQLLLAVLTLIATMGELLPAGLFVNALGVWAAYLAAARLRLPRRPLVIGWIASIPVSWLLIAGIGAGPLPATQAGQWGGLLLTVLLAVVGILLSFPLGVLLALGRRSSLPAARVLSTAYIELIRGVPLVTILFMADIMLPLLLPGEFRIDRVARAMGGITLFSAAYVAENVRGGLQAIPTGQVEAAHALGLNTVQTNLFIVLPQALRSVIPANVGLFISLLKDTTLVTIIGLFELLGIGRAILAQPESLGAHLEVYVFVAAVFFVLCYAMSQASYRLERALGVGVR